MVKCLNPDEIGNIAFSLSDKRISSLLSRFRARYVDVEKKKLRLPNDQQDFLQRLMEIENQIAYIDHQIKELQINFPDCAQSSRAGNLRVAMSTTDSELAKLVEDDHQVLINDRQRLENCLLSELAVWLLCNRGGSEMDMPKDLIMEVSAGIGGQEAMLFTKEIFDMYRRYAMHSNWKFDILEERSTDLNGLHFAAAAISGTDAYARLRFEGGVHRVQRIPATERTGRTHTSTMSVAILAQPPQSDKGEKINLKEFRFESFRPSAPGGQNVNKSDAGSRITHLPTGITVMCQMERYAHINRDLALRRLLAILYEKKTDARRNSIEQSRKLQVGSLARSEKVRTYNYQQDRITDHRTKQSFAGIPETLAGGDGLDRIIQSMVRFHLSERLSEALEEEEKEVTRSTQE